MSFNKGLTDNASTLKSFAGGSLVIPGNQIAAATANAPGAMSAADKRKSDLRLPWWDYSASPDLLGPSTVLLDLAAEDATAGNFGTWTARIPGQSNGTGVNNPVAVAASATAQAKVTFTAASSQYCTTTLNLASGGSVRAFTIIAFVRPASQADRNVVGFLGDDYTQFLYQNTPCVSIVSPTGNVSSPAIHRAATREWVAFVYDGPGRAARVLVNGTSTSAALSGGQTLSRGVQIGAVSGLNFFDGSMERVTIFAGALTDAQIYAQIPRMLASTKRQILATGDSISAGYNGVSYLSLLQDLLPSDYWVCCGYAVGGATLDNCNDQLSGRLLPQALPPAKRVLLHWAWTNAILNGATLAQIQASVVTTLAFAKANSMELMTLTCLPRSAFTAGQETIRTQLNAWLLASPELCSSGNGWVVDAASLPHAANTANATYYQDGTHPTSTLATEISTMVSRQLAAIGF